MSSNPQSVTRSDHVDPSSLFDVLADDQRQAIVRVLAASEEPIGRSTLARHLASGSADTGSPAPDTSSETMHIRLHHVHLPKLAAAGVVEYDATRETVAHGPHFDAAAVAVQRVTT